MATGARTGGEPSGAHWDYRAEARDTAGGPGRYTNTGHGAAVVACKSYSSNIVDVLIVLLTRPRPSSTTLATPSQNAAHSFSLLQQSPEDRLAQLNRAEFTTSLDAEKADLVEVENSVRSHRGGRCGSFLERREAEQAGK